MVWFFRTNMHKTTCFPVSHIRFHFMFFLVLHKYKDKGGRDYYFRDLFSNLETNTFPLTNFA